MIRNGSRNIAEQSQSFGISNDECMLIEARASYENGIRVSIPYPIAINTHRDNRNCWVKIPMDQIPAIIQSLTRLSEWVDSQPDKV